MTTELLPCPFCGSDPALLQETWENPNGIGYGSGAYVYVRCKCSAKGPYQNLENFNRFTKFNVEDFRANIALMVREELKYKEYVEEVRTKAMNAWNKRA